MIIAVREPDRHVRTAVGVVKRKGKLRYWKWMNNGRPILSHRAAAADFSGDVADKALRQVKTLYPQYAVEAVNRFEKKA